ncbi:hypothetical protein [Photobacterium aquae]|nr:hypothetical protein [Photobacterium aquae]
MKTLQQVLEDSGLAELPLTEKSNDYIAQFITQREDFFQRVCREKADKYPYGLSLGLMTQMIHAALENYQVTHAKTAELRTLITDHIGDVHAAKFTTMNDIEIQTLATVWLMVQGANGIDFSYANEQAEMLCSVLDKQSPTIGDNPIRSQLMQAYYIGVEHLRPEYQPTSLLASLSNKVKALFNT